MSLVCEVCGTVEQPAVAADSAALGASGDHLHVCPECVKDRQSWGASEEEAES